MTCGPVDPQLTRSRNHVMLVARVSPAIANAVIVIDRVPLRRTAACATAAPWAFAVAIRVNAALCELPLSRGSPGA